MRSAIRQVPRSRSALVLALVLTGFLGSQAYGADVLSIGDGDTITVREQGTKVKVRLACIDAPETSQRPYGLQSRDALRALLPIGSSITLKVKATDRYGRTVAEIYKGSRNLNQTLVGQGQAFVYWQYISGCDRQRYGQLERDARLKRLGVWSVAGGIQKLWDFRRGRKIGGSGSSAGHSSRTIKRKYRCSEVASWQQAQGLLKNGHSYLER